MSLTPVPDITQSDVVPAVHPTACPPWCKHRRAPQTHHFGPTMTWHWGPQFQLRNPDALSDVIPVIVRAQLFRCDEGDATGEQGLYLSGETDVELGRDDAEIFIGQMQGFVDTMRLMLQQMG